MAGGADGTVAAMGARLLDPRFKYVPAAATDVAATWRRFGFDPHPNDARRARQVLRHPADNTSTQASDNEADIGCNS